MNRKDNSDIYLYLNISPLKIDMEDLQALIELENKDQVLGFVKAKINWKSSMGEGVDVYDGLRMDKTHSEEEINTIIDNQNRQLLNRFHPIFENSKIACWKGIIWWEDETRETSEHGGESTLKILTDKICKILEIQK